MSKRKTTEQFINEAKKFHGNKYDYSKVDYINNSTKVTIICPVHGEFEQRPRSHLEGYGCAKCATSGFDKSKSAILYYLKVTTENNQVLYKIGITNRTVQERFNLTDLSKIEIVKQRTYENGQEAYDKEQEIIKKYAKYKYEGPKVLQNGNTELFTVDIRNLTRG